MLHPKPRPDPDTVAGVTVLSAVDQRGGFQGPAAERAPPAQAGEHVAGHGLTGLLLHRDYSILGSDIRVAIFDDMLEVGHAFKVQFIMKNQKEPAPASGRDQVGTKFFMSNEQANLLKKCKEPQSMLNLLKFSNRSDRTRLKKGSP